ncbi:MAG: dihydrofolate reductase [Chloroflexi bacterium]|nr:MAG: dihydrofolate reductase [Chloroflexota bacterium]TMG60226.1 MAG: dihydrofolate reductase [Chloroflexota bacterium]
MSRIAFVVARDRHGVIGKDGRLPWRLPDDMRHVRELTVGKPLIMGRRTFDSIGRPLPDRVSIVLTRDEAFRCDGCLVARTPDEAVALAGDAPEIIVFGGAGVFSYFLPRTDRIYLTEVDTEAAGDTYFPPLDPREWREVDRRAHPADARHLFAFSWITLERVR